MAADVRPKSTLYGHANLTDEDRILVVSGAASAGETSSTGFTWRAATPSAGSGTTPASEVRLGPYHQPWWWRPAVERLRHLVGLLPDWDSYGSPPVDRQKAHLTLGILSVLMGPDTPLPSMVPTRTGGVQIEWHRAGLDLEIEAISPNRVEYYVCTPDGQEREGEWAYDFTEARSLVRQLGTT